MSVYRLQPRLDTPIHVVFEALVAGFNALSRERITDDILLRIPEPLRSLYVPVEEKATPDLRSSADDPQNAVSTWMAKYDVLYAEKQNLETTLESVRGDVQGLTKHNNELVQQRNRLTNQVILLENRLADIKKAVL